MNTPEARAATGNRLNDSGANQNHSQQYPTMQVVNMAQEMVALPQPSLTVDAHLN